MAGKAKARGAPPKTLTGQLAVKALVSPWWEWVASEISLSPEFVGKVFSIEELSQMIPAYPDGRRPRPRTVARRLRPVLELVERGPNGSRGIGAKYRVIPAAQTPVDETGADGADELISVDEEWLLGSIKKMTGGGK